jgi:choline dehydrogenase-like flavoprotein
MPRWLPRALVNLFATRVYGFFLQTEDGSHPDNRVRIGAAGEPVLEYDPQLLPQYAGHRGFVRAFMRALLRAGRLPFEKDVDLTGTAHACGTLLMGSDPHTSVVDADGKVHGMTGLYVVDGSVLPRSSCMNPALTIYAWALRVAGRLLADVTQSPSTPAAS